MGAAAAIMTKAPFKIPAPPHPATALPRINIIEDCAAPQIIDPAMKTKKAPMKMNLSQYISAYICGELLSCLPWSRRTDRVSRKEAAAHNFSISQHPFTVPRMLPEPT